MKIGILGAADIAFRRFLPALQKCTEFTYAGVASQTPKKAVQFQENFGGLIYSSYAALLEDDSIDIVYVPLPPALHYEWGRRVLQKGKHLIMEKPFTTKLEQTNRLLELAKEKNLTVYENYMFLCHSQLAKIKGFIADGILGEIRLYRMAFGFPKRGIDDFRYHKALGGGALLDCGGYPVRLALDLLGNAAHIVQAKLIQPKEYEVDLFGSAVLENNTGQIAQISFGMDNAYQCQLEVWGSTATLIASRIFTAGAEIKPTLILRSSSGEKHFNLKEEDQFIASIQKFKESLFHIQARNQIYSGIQQQAILIDQIFQWRGTV